MSSVPQPQPRVPVCPAYPEPLVSSEGAKVSESELEPVCPKLLEPLDLVLPKMASLYLWFVDLFCFHRLCSISASSQASTEILLSQLAFLSLCLATPQRLVPCPASPIPALYQVSRVNPSALPFSSLPASHQVPEIIMSVVATPLPSLLRGPFSTANVNDSHLPSK